MLHLMASSLSDDLNNKNGSTPNVVVIMGVTGSGKSTVGEMLAKTMKFSFVDADDFHPQANIEKMSKGIPLSEEDRVPWLETLRDNLRKRMCSGKAVILGCSALQKRYREILRTADPDYESGRYDGRVKFVCLEAPMEVIAARVERRAAEGKHFMPATLLKSQMDLFQIDEAEKDIFIIDATLTPQIIVNNIQALIFGLNILGSSSSRHGLTPNAVVIMGVTGSGKSTVGEMLAKTTKFSYLGADDFHPQANLEKMRKGIPLSEEDRIPWLETLRNNLRKTMCSGETVILGCSALQKRYREILRTADPDYESGRYDGRVKLICLEAPMEVIAARVERRAAEGMHFMPATLLNSQMDLFQIDDAEKDILMIDATPTPQIIVNNIQALIF